MVSTVRTFILILCEGDSMLRMLNGISIETCTVTLLIFFESTLTVSTSV